MPDERSALTGLEASLRWSPIEGTRGHKGTEGTASNGFQPLGDDGPLVQGPLGPLVTSGRVLVGERVESWLKLRWGADEHGSFPCPLPGHTGTALLVHEEGDLRLGCCSGRWRSPGEVRAAEAYGYDKLRTNIEIAIWLRRIAYEAGTFEPIEIVLPALPSDVSPATES
jgi:hypothetical protein